MPILGPGCRARAGLSVSCGAMRGVDGRYTGRCRGQPVSRSSTLERDRVGGGRRCPTVSTEMSSYPDSRRLYHLVQFRPVSAMGGLVALAPLHGLVVADP